jgi:predicted nuclease of predicted toxin-antitoxin system
MIWIDAQLSPYLAKWIKEEFKLEAKAVRELNLRDAPDKEIFLAAKEANAIVITKDIDFCRLLDRLGTPPKIIWITCGNTSNKRLKEILLKNLTYTLDLMEKGEPLVEISDR